MLAVTGLSVFATPPLLFAEHRFAVAPHSSAVLRCKSITPCSPSQHAPLLSPRSNYLLSTAVLTPPPPALLREQKKLSSWFVESGLQEHYHAPISWSRNWPVEEEMASLVVTGGNATEQVVLGVCSSCAVSQRPEGSLAGEVLRWQESQAQGIIFYMRTYVHSNKFAWCLIQTHVAS